MYVLSKPQIYPLPECFRRSRCLMTLMIICSGMHLAQPLGGEGKYAQSQFSVWANCSIFRMPFFSRMMTDFHPFPVSVAALPATGRGSIPHISGNCREQAKHYDQSSWARADTEKQQQLDRIRHLGKWRWELLCDISKQTLKGWDWS